MAGLIDETQVLRLLRTRWKGPQGAQMLAEEMYAILSTTRPITLTGPVTINNPTTDPGLKINNADPELDLPVNDVGIRMQDKDGTTKDLRIEPDKVPGKKKKDDEPPSAVGKISSGSGSEYRVDLYENGQGSDSTRTVDATQLQIVEDEDIPSGTWCLVLRVGEEYFVQVPVWL